MPKMKTHRASAKRFSFTGTGKVRSRKGGASHLLGHKSRKRKRRLKRFDVMDPAMERHVRRALPYGG
jgi:large subunit ribosomal protein L35